MRRGMPVLLVALAAASLAVNGAAVGKGKAKRPAGGGAPSASGGKCNDSDDAALWWSPAAPAVGAMVRVMGVGESTGELTIVDPDGSKRTLNVVRRPGSPDAIGADFKANAAGRHTIAWSRGDKQLACRRGRRRRATGGAGDGTGQRGLAVAQ